MALNFSVDLSLDYTVVTKILVGFIADCFQKADARRAVIGLSGGLDSAVVAKLSAEALRLERVLGVVMPYKTSAPESIADALRFGEWLGIRTELVDISPLVDAYFSRQQEADANRRGNTMARTRMIVLYDISAREHGLVIGTSNKSELLLGYGTIFGDLACAINPVGDLYKTQMRQLAEYLEIPEYIRKKTPTADLFQGQTDEGDLGFTYDEADRLLFLWVDQRVSEEELKEYGFAQEFINAVFNRVRKNNFKRLPPLIAKFSGRTIGHEFRYPWEWSFVK
jgi:NAD+ synthase